MLAVPTGMHWTAIAASTLASAMLGALYFMVLVPKQYLYVTGRENLPKDQQSPTGAIFIVGPMICSLVTIIADAMLIKALGIASVADAAAVGIFVGLGFLIPMTFNIAINPLFPRPIQYGLLNAPYFLTANLIACVFLVIIPF